MTDLSSITSDISPILKPHQDFQLKSTSSDNDPPPNILSVTPDYSTYYPSHQSLPITLHYSTTQPSKTVRNQKQELCKSFTIQGSCAYGSQCRFAHGPNQLQQNRGPNKKYKTRLCANFHKEGNCRYGSRCNYIHYQSRKSERVCDSFSDIFKQNCETLRQYNVFIRKQSRILGLLKENQGSN